MENERLIRSAAHSTWTRRGGVNAPVHCRGRKAFFPLETTPFLLQYYIKSDQFIAAVLLRDWPSPRQIVKYEDHTLIIPKNDLSARWNGLWFFRDQFALKTSLLRLWFGLWDIGGNPSLIHAYETQEKIPCIAFSITFSTTKILCRIWRTRPFEMLVAFAISFTFKR